MYYLPKCKDPIICFIPILLMLIDKTYVFQNPKTSHSNDDCAVGSPLAMTANSPAHETYLLDERQKFLNPRYAELTALISRNHKMI